MEHLWNDRKDYPNQHKNSHKLCDKMEHPVANWWEVNGNWETETTTSEFPNGGKAIVKQILASEERNKSKRAGLWDTVWDLSRKVNHLSKVISDRKIITEFTRSISFTRIGKPVAMMDVKVFKDKNISRWVDWKNLIYVRWNRIKNRAKKRRRWLIE